MDPEAMAISQRPRSVARVRRFVTVNTLPAMPRPSGSHASPLLATSEGVMPWLMDSAQSRVRLRRMLGYAEVVPFGIGHRCPLDMRDLVENVPAVCGAERHDAFHLVLA